MAFTASRRAGSPLSCPSRHSREQHLALLYDCFSRVSTRNLVVVPVSPWSAAARGTPPRARALLFRYHGVTHGQGACCCCDGANQQQGIAKKKVRERERESGAHGLQRQLACFLRRLLQLFLGWCGIASCSRYTLHRARHACGCLAGEDESHSRRPLLIRACVHAVRQV